MEFKIENKDTHVILDVPGLDDTTVTDLPSNQLVGKSVILNLMNLGRIEENQMNIVKRLVQQNAGNTKFLVVVTENKINDDSAPKNVVFLRSVEEGVDAIFMNDLENQFKEDIGS